MGLARAVATFTTDRAKIGCFVKGAITENTFEPNDMTSDAVWISVMAFSLEGL